MRRMIFALFAALTLLLGVSVSSSASNHNCGDYVSQAAAQSVLNADPSDPYGLDGDDDGEACERYDYANNPGTNPGVGGGGDNGDTDNGDNGDTDNGTVGELPATGSGPMSSTGSSSAPLFGAFALLLAGVSLVLRRSPFGRS